jgi:hypothetical protein
MPSSAGRVSPSTSQLPMAFELVTAHDLIERNGNVWSGNRSSRSKAIAKQSISHSISAVLSMKTHGVRRRARQCLDSR